MSFKSVLANFDLTLDEETEARYLCLLERLEFIDKKLMDLGMDEEKLETARTSNKVHKALVGYIDERYQAMLYDVQCDNQRKELK